jgi:hypothetical protein
VAKSRNLHTNLFSSIFLPSDGINALLMAKPFFVHLNRALHASRLAALRRIHAAACAAISRRDRSLIGIHQDAG